MDLLILGGGPAGVAAALRARELSADVTLLESKRIGGISANGGPAPVRTLARAARLVRDASSWSTFGLKGPRPEVDLEGVIANAVRVANYAHEQRHLGESIRACGIELIEGAGPARLLDSHRVGLSDGRTWQADSIILAVGGHGRKLPIPGAELALTHSDIWSLRHLPARVAVIGGSDTGCQLASIFEDFGCDVTIIEIAPRLIPGADVDVSRALTDAFVRQGMVVLTGTTAERIERAGHGGGFELRYGRDGSSSSVTTDVVFFATGWSGNVEALDVGAAGVAIESSYVVVNDYLQTSVPHIYAAGDINGRSMLVQRAVYEGNLAAENAVVGPHRRFTHDIVPSGSFTDPEYASVGMTEAQARERYDCAVAVVRYNELLRPVADGRPEGFCKLIVDARQRYILGAHVLGEYSAEVIQMVTACMAGGMRIEQLAELQLAYPTFTEAVGLAARRLVRELQLTPLAPTWSAAMPLSF
jgi:pyruvate/2-oxoglutarate dehydrogenase complex dihydrolipoamide dehydrogenase (E3) component